MRRRSSRGFGLIESMVAIAVLAILISIAVPSYQQMIQNGRTRTIAESFRSGVDLARAEAMRRNAPVGFAVVSSTTGCTASSTGTGWVVFLGTACGANATVVQRFDAGISAPGVTVNASPNVVAFNGLGFANAAATFNFSNNLPEAQRRNLRLLISTGGQTRLCDPGVTSSGDPRAC